jgi:hypothetical protein
MLGATSHDCPSVRTLPDWEPSSALAGCGLVLVQFEIHRSYPTSPVVGKPPVWQRNVQKPIKHSDRLMNWKAKWNAVQQEYRRRQRSRGLQPGRCPERQGGNERRLVRSRLPFLRSQGKMQRLGIAGLCRDRIKEPQRRRAWRCSAAHGHCSHHGTAWSASVSRNTRTPVHTLSRPGTPVS